MGPEDLGLRGILHASWMNSPPSMRKGQEILADRVFAAL